MYRHPETSRRGFTLIELLVVIAIIAILIGLLLPAVQKVREAAANARCKNSFKQLGIAMHMYHDSASSLPLGAVSNPRHTWVVHLWPYIEQGTMLSAYGNPATQQFYLPPATITSSLTGVLAKPISILYCPSDRPGAMWMGDSYWRARGNYVVNWGSRTTTGTSVAEAPFGLMNGNTTTPALTQISSITDGLSNTLMMSEVVVTRNDNEFNTRGDIYNDDASGASAMFMTITTPNTGTDVMYCNVNNDPTAPCIPPNGNNYSTARSRHNGGVNALLCDGSTRFVANSVLLATWQALGTKNGGETIPDF